MDRNRQAKTDPSTDQFVSVDPDLGTTGQPYTYAGSDPVNGSDPSGDIEGFCPDGWCPSTAGGLADNFTGSGSGGASTGTASAGSGDGSDEGSYMASTPYPETEVTQNLGSYLIEGIVMSIEVSGEITVLGPNANTHMGVNLHTNGDLDVNLPGGGGVSISPLNGITGGSESDGPTTYYSNGSESWTVQYQKNVGPKAQIQYSATLTIGDNSTFKGVRSSDQAALERAGVVTAAGVGIGAMLWWAAKPGCVFLGPAVVPCAIIF